jgi:small-conductance mechanosensitive channel
MKEIFDYSFYSSDLVDFSVRNILILLIILVATRYLLKFYRVFIHKKIRALDVFDHEREQILLRIGRGTIVVSAIVGIIISLGLWPLLKVIFSYEILHYQSFVITPGKILILILIIIFAQILSRLIRVILKQNFSKKTWIDEGKEYTIVKLTKYSLYGVAFIIGLTSIGLDMKILIGAAGALLVGLGFGLQNLFYDLISGFIILFEGPVKVGDVVEVDGLVARVQQIDIRTSKVMTRDGKYIIIPNSHLIGERVVNWSHGTLLTRFHIKVGVKYGSDTALVKDVLYNCAIRHPDVSKNREIIVRFDEFGDSSLSFSVFFWAKKTWVVETLQSEIRFEIDRQFRENGITIPFPQRDLHIIPQPGKKQSNEDDKSSLKDPLK